MAEILFGLSEADAQLELQEKHYEKLKVCFIFITKFCQFIGY